MVKFLSPFSSLRGRLVILICLATLPAILFAFYLAQNERSLTQQRIEESGHHLITLISREYLNQMTGAKSLLQWLSTRLVKEGSESLVSDPFFLAALLAGHPQLGNIAILKPDGEVINSAYPLNDPVNMHNYNVVQRALHSQKIETGTYVVGPIVKRPLLHLAYAIRDDRKAIRWIVFVALDLEWLTRLTDSVELPTDYVLLLVDREGKVLINSTTSSFINLSSGQKIPELAGLTVQQEFKTVSTRINGQLFSFFIASMKDLPGIFVASALPREKIIREANYVFYRMLGLLGLLTLFTVISVLIVEEIALLRVIRSLSGATQRFGGGDYSVRITIPSGYGELKKVAVAFNTMAETLSYRHNEIVEAHHKLERLTRHLQVARETEAQRISRDLHDEVGQILTSIKMDLANFQRKFGDKADPEIDSKISKSIGAMRDKINALVEFIRRLASDLRPPILDRKGLVSAINLLARSLEVDAELVVDVEASDMQKPFDWLVSTTLYRITQEALTNICRHAQATEVVITLRRNNEIILLSIQDNGKGFDFSAWNGETLGLTGMRERVRLIGGTFSLKSTPGKGTIIEITVPVNLKESDAYSPLF